MFLANANVSKRDVSSFEEIICAGSPLPEGIAEKVTENMKLKYFRQGIIALLTLLILKTFKTLRNRHLI